MDPILGIILISCLIGCLIYIWLSEKFMAQDDKHRAHHRAFTLRDVETGKLKQADGDLRGMLMSQKIDIETLKKEYKEHVDFKIKQVLAANAENHVKLTRLELSNQRIEKRQQILRDALVPKKVIHEFSVNGNAKELEKTVKSVAKQLEAFE